MEGGDACTCWEEDAHEQLSPFLSQAFASAGQTLQVWSHSRIGDIAKMPEPCLGRNAPAGSAGKAAILPVTGEVLPTEDTEGNSPDWI